MKYLTAAQLDDLVGQAEAFQMVLLDAYDASGHGWAPATGPVDEWGLLVREDKNCVLCGEPMPCPVFYKITEAGRGVGRRSSPSARASGGRLVEQWSITW